MGAVVHWRNFPNLGWHPAAAALKPQSRANFPSMLTQRREKAPRGHFCFRTQRWCRHRKKYPAGGIHSHRSQLRVPHSARHPGSLGPVMSNMSMAQLLGQAWRGNNIAVAVLGSPWDRKYRSSRSHAAWGLSQPCRGQPGAWRGLKDTEVSLGEEVEGREQPRCGSKWRDACTLHPAG